MSGIPCVAFCSCPKTNQFARSCVRFAFPGSPLLEFLSWGCQRTSFHRFRLLRPLTVGVAKPPTSRFALAVSHDSDAFLRNEPLRVCCASLPVIGFTEFPTLLLTTIVVFAPSFPAVQSYPSKLFPRMQPYCVTTAFAFSLLITLLAAISRWSLSKRRNLKALLRNGFAVSSYCRLPPTRNGVWATSP